MHQDCDTCDIHSAIGLPELVEVLPFGDSPAFLLVLKNHRWTGIQLHIFLLPLLILKFADLGDRLSLTEFEAASWFYLAHAHWLLPLR